MNVLTSKVTYCFRCVSFDPDRFSKLNIYLIEIACNLWKENPISTNLTSLEDKTKVVHWFDGAHGTILIWNMDCIHPTCLFV